MYYSYAVVPTGPVCPSDSLVALEEAEASLHPRAQVSLCDALLDVARDENKQTLLTTHSEHILTGFLNLVAEGKLSADELRVYHFTKEAGEAKAILLRVDEKGGVQGGLKGFFEVNLEGYERRLKALSCGSKSLNMGNHST